MPRTRPNTIQEVSDLVQNHAASQGPLTEIDTSDLQSIIEFSPSDLTVQVEAGLTLSRLQETLETNNLWLPVDPANSESLTLGELINQNAYGPSRLGYGTIRDYLIGGRFVTADGEIVKSGSSVVKNVAGFDLLKLFIGAKGCLGIPVELIFKTLPRPQKRQQLRFSTNTFEELQETIDAIWDANLAPTRLDVVGIETNSPKDAKQCSLYIQFEGAPADVDYQISKTLESAPFLQSNEDYYISFLKQFKPSHKPGVHSVLPSESLDAARNLSTGPFLLHAGFGALLAEQSLLPPRSEPSGAHLMRRAKSIFDPKGVFPNLER